MISSTGAVRRAAPLRGLLLILGVVMLGTLPAAAQQTDLPISLSQVETAPHEVEYSRLRTPSPPSHEADGALLDELLTAGHEHIRVHSSADTLYLSFEYRMGRGSYAGACEALDAAGPGFRHAVVVLEHQEIPMTAISFDGPSARPTHLVADSSGSLSAAHQLPRSTACAGYRVASATMNVAPYADPLAQGQADEDRFIDISLHPRYSALFGFYRDPVMLQLNLAPRLNVRLWRGFEISAQVIFPLYNEFSTEGDFVRPGLLTASQFVRLPGPTFVRATAGTFTNRRFGIDVRTRRFFDDGRFRAGFDLGRTGNAYFPNGSIFVERDPEWVVLGTAGFTWRRQRLYVDGAAGRFLFGDLGGRIEVMRQFGQADIGFVFAQTVNGANAGLRLILPLFEDLYVGSSSVRVRPAPDFTWDYMYRAGTNVGESYDTGYFMDRVYRQHQPSYMYNVFSTP